MTRLALAIFALLWLASHPQTVANVIAARTADNPY
jgi:putative flippase GtrA